jgi:glycosyltransferase involved in cell wall biosynthesis
VKGLRKHGVDITLVLPTAAESDDDATIVTPSQERPSIRYVRTNLRPYEGVEEYDKRIGKNVPGKNLTELYGPDLGAAVESFAEMSVAMTQDLTPDVIHCHDWMTYGAGVKAKAYHKVPLVMHIHATEFDRTNFHPDQWIAERERQGLLAADKVIAVSSYTKNLLVQHYGIPAEKISVIHNGHDQVMAMATNDVTTSQTHVPLVLFLGRLTVQKNPWQFLETAKVIHDLQPDVQFVMAGEGGMLPGLIDHACELGLTDCMTFTGKVSRDDVDALYRKADCFVMPSLSEPFGLVALEAIGNGVPVVLSKQSGAAEVVEHAFHVDFWDTERFADCILTILREQPLTDQLRSEAPRVLDRLSWSNQAGNVVSLYRTLIQS